MFSLTFNLCPVAFFQVATLIYFLFYSNVDNNIYIDIMVKIPSKELNKTKSQLLNIKPTLVFHPFLQMAFFISFKFQNKVNLPLESSISLNHLSENL